MRPVTIILLG